MFFGARLSLLYMPTSPDASFIQKFQDGGRIPEVIITLRWKTIWRWSQRLRLFYRASRQYPTSENSIRYKPEVETVPPNRKFARDAVFRSRMLSIRAQPSLESPKHCISHWDRVDICFRFWVISTSGLYMMVFTEVVQCRYRWKWIVRARKHYRSRWNHVDRPIVFRHQITTTSGIRPWSWTSAWRKRRMRLAYKPVKNLPQNIGIAFEIASISVSVARLLVLPVWILFLLPFCTWCSP